MMSTMSAYSDDFETVSLPDPQMQGDMSVEKALDSRRSLRSFSPAPLTPGDLSQLVWAAQGISGGKAALRTAPSAGALYPLELYVIVENVENIPPGLYHYDPLKHELKQIHKEEGYAGLVAEAAFGQSWVSDAPAIIVLTGIYERTAKKYGGYAERYVHIETGHAAQNVYLQAETLGLGTTIVGAFDDDKIRAILKSDEDETPLAALPVGYPAE